MGEIIRGQLCFGILFEEGFEFPWDKEPFDGDIAKWWYFINGYKPPFEIFDENGMWIDGVAPEEDRVQEYFETREKFRASVPLPVEIVNYCHCNYPAYIITLKKHNFWAVRGYPERVYPSRLTASAHDEMILTNFCRKHGIEFKENPHWYLSSCQG